MIAHGWKLIYYARFNINHIFIWKIINFNRIYLEKSYIYEKSYINLEKAYIISILIWKNHVFI